MTSGVAPRFAGGVLTGAAFAGVAVFGGANFVAAHFSNQELPPLFGAGVRFAAATLLFLGFLALRRIRLPTGVALGGTVAFGVLLATANGLSFWALLRVPAAIAGIVMAGVPLLTSLLAWMQRLEPFRLRGMVGGGLAVAGIAALRSPALGVDVPLLPLLAMVGAALCAAEAGIVVKKYPAAHPAATNGVAMAIGAVVLLAVSAWFGEAWSVPARPATWLALGHLVVLGSIALFALYLFMLARWTASGASYALVVSPLVAALLAAWLAAQPITWGWAVAAMLVLAGVYVGALSEQTVPVPASPEEEALAQRCATC